MFNRKSVLEAEVVQFTKQAGMEGGREGSREGGKQGGPNERHHQVVYGKFKIQCYWSLNKGFKVRISIACDFFDKYIFNLSLGKQPNFMEVTC